MIFATMLYLYLLADGTCIVVAVVGFVVAFTVADAHFVSLLQYFC